MKKILLPIALFAVLGLAACGDDVVEAGCEQADPIEGSKCDISVAELCPEEELYKYKGKEYKEDEIDKLIDALQKDGHCQATLSPEDRAKIRTALTSQAKRLLDRIRVNAIRAI
jgi:hypothetical protein